MPRIHADTLRQVAAALRHGASIAAPYHGDRRGHPVGFAPRWYDALVALSGDEGARTLLGAHGEAITRIQVDDPGCVFDVDTPGDLKNLTGVPSGG
jgi:molybdenum cofactor cytidylyltransferase